MLGIDGQERPVQRPVGRAHVQGEMLQTGRKFRVHVLEPHRPGLRRAVLLARLGRRRAVH